MRGEFKGFFIMKQIYNDALQFCIDRCSNVASNKPIELFFAFKIDLKIDWALLDYVWYLPLHFFRTLAAFCVLQLQQNRAQSRDA